MNYEKKYKEALERAKKELNACGSQDCDAARQIFRLFPELKETEDEKIRKKLITFFQQFRFNIEDTINAEEAIAWLEKLKVFAEHGDGLYYFGNNGFTYVGNANKNVVDFKAEDWYVSKIDGKIHNNCHSDKAEPKFKVGDWITFYEGKPFKIIKIEAEINGVLDYLLLDQNDHDSYYNKRYVDENARLWTIQDAKPGDVLVAPKDEGSEHSEQIFIFKEIKNRDYVKNAVEYYCRVVDNKFYVNKSGHMGQSNEYFVPATKEQRELLFQKMHESGYEWDAEKKVLKEIL